MTAALTFSLTACGGSESQQAASEAGSTASEDEGADAEAEGANAENEEAEDGESATEEGGKSFSVGICNYVDHASLNQIVDSLQAELEEKGAENDITFNVSYDNCNADANVMDQIIANFDADNVDLMVGVATPVAMAMQADTEDSKIPVVFAAVSDPESAGLVSSLEEPGANVTGTSDYLDSHAIMDLIFAANPDAKKIGLLYDVGQDSSTTPIEAAKAYLEDKGVEYVERTGTTADEVAMAADAL
ncbi:MAG: ABC transporter substrate-binding protein, partial [Lachnospiraceae bacterium]|nr:ABC transporter substrate-binding protein [Lachnospiraceae bacterium]